jgi:copper homeostasis protein
MIRPRTGDFLYTSVEIDVMLEDIRVFRNLGIQGIVVGILTQDGRVDTERMKLYVLAFAKRRSGA